MRRGTILVTLLLTVTMAASAQVRGRTPAPSCSRIDTTASWYLTQKAWWMIDAAHDWTNDTMRTMLLDAARPLDRPSPSAFPLQLGALVVGEPESVLHGADSARVAVARDQLRAMLKTRSWPTRAMVGPAGIRAAWLIARGDSALGIGAMHRMMEAGPGEALAADVAMLEDWSRVLKGRKPIYATRLELQKAPGGVMKLSPIPTEDLPHVDLRREAAGLPPLAMALCMARSGKGN